MQEPEWKMGAMYCHLYNPLVIYLKPSHVCNLVQIRRSSRTCCAQYRPGRVKTF